MQAGRRWVEAKGVCDVRFLFPTYLGRFCIPLTTPVDFRRGLSLKSNVLGREAQDEEEEEMASNDSDGMVLEDDEDQQLVNELPLGDVF